MESRRISKEEFDSAVVYNYEVLKRNFIADVNKASNEAYAYLHCRKTYFERNVFIPYCSAFFQNLEYAYIHYFNMDEPSSFEKTMAFLPTIREIAKSKILECESGLLPELYAELIENENCTLEEILAMERGALSLDEENVAAILALYQATQQLLRDLPEFYPQPKFEKEHQHVFTRSQQVLFAHYFFKLADIRQVDKATLARILHGVAGVPYNDIKNSEFYKKLCGVLQTDKRTGLSDLQLVRSYFVKLNRQDILDIIDKDIRSLQ